MRMKRAVAAVVAAAGVEADMATPTMVDTGIPTMHLHTRMRMATDTGIHMAW